MTAKPWYERETVGWIMWGVVSVLLLAPGLWAAWSITYDTASTGMRIGFGVGIAAVLGAVITSTVTWVGQTLDARTSPARSKAASGPPTEADDMPEPAAAPSPTKAGAAKKRAKRKRAKRR